MENELILTNGSKIATIKQTTNGYNEKVFRVAVVQSFNNGIEMEERFIATNDYQTMRGAKHFANYHLS